MSFAENLANVVNRYDEISSLLSSPDVTPENLVKMNKELAELGPVVEAVNHYRKAEKDLNDAKAMMEDPGMDAGDEAERITWSLSITRTDLVFLP